MILHATPITITEDGPAFVMLAIDNKPFVLSVDVSVEEAEAFARRIFDATTVAREHNDWPTDVEPESVAAMRRRAEAAGFNAADYEPLEKVTAANLKPNSHTETAG